VRGLKRSINLKLPHRPGALGSDNGTVERNGIRYIAAKKDGKIYCLIEVI